MRTLAAILTLGLLAADASAQQPLDPYAPAAAPGSEPADPYATPAMPAQPAPQAAPVPAYPYPPQPTGYYYPPVGYAAPIYSYPPPPVYYPQPAPRPVRVRPVASCTTASCGPRPPMISVGLRLSALGINQEINGKDVVLGGGGLQLRFRTRGRFGMEAAVDALHGSFAAPPSAGPAPAPGQEAAPGAPSFRTGTVTRDSIPLSLSALVYIFPNQIERVFNLYFLGGIGAVHTTMGLTDPNGRRVSQEFAEVMAHLGLGLELRFRWIALHADLRGVALARDDSERPASYYAGVDGGPVPRSSTGLLGNVGATLWF